MDGTQILWLVLLVVFLIAEASTVVLVSLWFAAGALVALIASFCGAKLWLQVLLFLAVSAALLSALRPLMTKWIQPNKKRTNLDAVIGSAGIVLERIDNLHAVGRVKLGAMEWTARSTNEEPIEPGTQVTVDKIEGVKVFVTPVPVTAGSKEESKEVTI